MKNILLLGELGKRYGRKYRLNIKTPAEAVRALCANFSDFEKFVCDSGKRNVGYRVLVGKKDITGEELHDPIGSQDIKIVPVIAGAGGGGIGTIILGVALVALSFYIPGSMFAINAALATGISVTTMASAAFYVGAALVLSGASQMLAATPEAAQPSERPENQPSYVFNGAVNTTAQGQPVPIGYGRLIVGSAVVSAGISVEEIPR
jgi:predicted phage tail protein